MAYQFNVPNPEQYLPQIQPASGSAEEVTQQPGERDMQRQIIEMLMQRLQAQPPQIPQQPAMSRRQKIGYSLASGPLQQMMIESILRNDPAHRQYAQQTEQYEAGQKQI